MKNLKETIVITNPELGIKAIPFLRTWVLVPATILFVKGYAVLSTRYSQPKVIYIILSAFLSYYLLFIFALYPNDEAIRLSSVANFVIGISDQLKPIGELIRFWSFSLYYCISEAWGTLVILILFWGTCNRSNTLEQAKRFYCLLLIITNLSGVFASQVTMGIANGIIKGVIFPDLDRWGAILSSVTLVACLIITVMMGLFYAFFNYILNTNEREATRHHVPLSKKEMSLVNVIKFISTDRRYWPLAFMVFAYFFCSGLMEIYWQYYLHKIYPSSIDFNEYLNKTTLIISISSTVLTIVTASNILRKFSWKLIALIPPVLLFIPLSLLIYNVTFNQYSPDYYDYCVLFATGYYVLSKVCKFTFFDFSKEIATVEFSYNEQIKLKTVVDGIIPRISKTSESLFLQSLILTIGTFDIIVGFILICVLSTNSLWAMVVRTGAKEVPSSVPIKVE
jgi:AAA family ATP:ADP antiporter